MAFLLPNLSPSLLQPKSNNKQPQLQQQQQQQQLPLIINQTFSPLLSSSSPSSTTKPNTNTLSPLFLPSLQTPTANKEAHLRTPPSPSTNENDDGDDGQRDDFYVNLGLAVRTLREDMPLIFAKDLNYDIYRDDITFLDPLNIFTGIENYKLIFWALKFHGKILFREISLDVFRVWQPSENMILIRWNLRGVPRVPWEAKGQFQGTSRYKLDRNGKIYEHKVDNLAFNFPQPPKPAVSVLDLVTACPASPNPTFLWAPVEQQSSSWVEFYRAVRETLDRQGQDISVLAQNGFLTCS